MAISLYKRIRKIRLCLNLFFKEFKDVKEFNVLKVFKVIISFLLGINKNSNLK